MKKLKHGEKVMDRYGFIYTVDEQEGNTVYLEVHASNKVTMQRKWIHRTKCFRVKPERKVGNET